MSSETSRISSAIHAACVVEVMTGTTLVGLLGSENHCNARGFAAGWLGILEAYGPNTTELRCFGQGRTRASAVDSSSLFLRSGYFGLNFALGEAGFDFVAGLYGLRGFQELAFGVKGQ